MPTPFPPNKTARDLGIDTTRKFVMMKDYLLFPKGEILVLFKDDDTDSPYFISIKDGIEHAASWSSLAYYEEPVTERKFEVGQTIEFTVRTKILKIDSLNKTDLPHRLEGDMDWCNLNKYDVKIIEPEMEPLTKAQAKMILEKRYEFKDNVFDEWLDAHTKD